MAFCVFISAVKTQYLWHVDKCVFNCSMDISHLFRCFMCFPLTLWRKMCNYLQGYGVCCSLLYFHFLCSDRCRMVTSTKTIVDAEHYLNCIAKVESYGLFCKSRSWTTHGESLSSSSTSLCLSSLHSSRKKGIQINSTLKKSPNMYLGADFIIDTAVDYDWCLLSLVLCGCVCSSHDCQDYGVQWWNKPTATNCSSPAESKWVGQV